MMVRLFDRYSKLRAHFRVGQITDEPKQMLPLLKGRLSKEDLPTAIVEPGDLDELRATLEFAAEKKHKIAVAAGLTPTPVHHLENHLLILTTRLSQAPIISSLRRSARVSGGFPVESLAIDLARENLDWWPLHPVPSGESIGSLIASGWEGVRSFRRGGTLCHINFIEWMGYDGKAYASGPSIATTSSPDLSGILFGSNGAAGIVTAVELSLHPSMQSRSAALLEFPSAEEAIPFFAEIASCAPTPESVVFWGATASEIIRSGNDGTVRDGARFVVLVEWDVENVILPSPWDGYARYVDNDARVRALWQDVLRMSRTASRLFPGRIEARVRLSAAELAEIEDAAAELGRDANLSIAVWGAPEAGYVYLWVFMPDTEHVTRTRARETLNRLLEIAINLGATYAPGEVKPVRSHSTLPELKLVNSLRGMVTERCDPHVMHSALHSD
jgi:FAD/FMN-containing dehydrogenase